MRITTPVDRETAARINPLISSLWTEDTLAGTAQAVYELGYLIAGTELDTGGLYRVFEAIAAALQYEKDNLRSFTQERKGADHV